MQRRRTFIFSLNVGELRLDLTVCSVLVISPVRHLHLSDPFIPELFPSSGLCMAYCAAHLSLVCSHRVSLLQTCIQVCVKHLRRVVYFASEGNRVKLMANGLAESVRGYGWSADAPWCAYVWLSKDCQPLLHRSKVMAQPYGRPQTETGRRLAELMLARPPPDARKAVANPTTACSVASPTRFSGRLLAAGFKQGLPHRHC